MTNDSSIEIVDQELRPQPTVSWIQVLFILLLSILIGSLLGGVSLFVVAAIKGLPFADLINALMEEEGLGGRMTLRTIAMLNSFFTFVVPALLTAYICYRKKWLHYLAVLNKPSYQASLMAMAMIFVSFPIVQLSYLVNQQIPLPSWMISAEDSTNALINGILQMDSPLEFIVGFMTVALLPAIGEELLFRGVIQKELTKISPNGHLAVWLTAIIFSAFHLQFVGFLPRMILGAVLGYLYLWTANLWMPIIGHLFFNGFQVITVYFTGNPDVGEEMIQEEVSKALPFLLIFSAVGAFLLYRIGQWFKRRGALNEDEMPPQEGLA